MAETETNIRRCTDSPTDQDLGAAIKALWNPEDLFKCCVCGSKNGHMWGHYDSWTKWLRYGCGTNVYYCDNKDCGKAAEEIAHAQIDANRKQAEEAERETLRHPSTSQRCRIHSRYVEYECGKGFRDWVESVVGTEEMQKLLDVPCATCGKVLGPTKYFFQDEITGEKSQKTIVEIEQWTKERNGIATEETWSGISPISLFSYKMRKHGWGKGTPSSDHDWSRIYPIVRDEIDKEGWNSITSQVILRDDQIIAHWQKAGGDWPRYIHVNHEETRRLQSEWYDRLKKRTKGTNEHANEQERAEYKAIEDGEQWAYFCSEVCQATVKGMSTTFI